MERAIRERYDKAIEREVLRRYGIAFADATPLDGFESFIYAYEQDGRDYILRVGHNKRRTPELIRGEVDWINYLAAGGAGVAGAVPSRQDNLVEEVPDATGGRFLATAFHKARGGPVWEMGGWTDGAIDAYGRLLGRIHALSKSYAVSNPAWRRPAWDDPSNVNLAPLEPVLSARFQDVLRHLRSLPQDEESYGMIHQDAHAGNFFIDRDDQLTLFDFDDCCYGHFVYDLAMVLFYATTNREDAAEFGPYFWTRFMRGYYAENNLDPAWQQEIPTFMKLREIDLYAILKRDYDPAAGDSWGERFMNGRRERIENGIPCIEMEF